VSELAVNGGPKIRERVFPAHAVMGEEEARAAYDVVKGGILSKFLGCWDPDFFGGEQVQAFEREWAAHFGSRHAIAVNSNSSGILCALGALELGAGDEVIVSPYTMSVSASAPLVYGALPVFADIEPDTFCLDPASVEARITSRTRAIVAVDIFGQPYDKEGIDRVAARRGIPVIEDVAQAPDASWKGRYAGTLGRLGVFSLNYHKHIHTGEGGVIVTDDDDLAMRCRLIRNHAEAVVDGMGYAGSPANLVGFNLRMTEIEAAIGRIQLRKLTALVEERRRNVAYLESKLAGIPFLALPKVRRDCRHSYYVHALKFDAAAAGTTRDRFVAAVAAELPPTALRESEGPLISQGYVRPLYLQSLYQKRAGFGRKGYPFRDPANDSVPDYRKGLCPVAERLHGEELLYHEMMRPGMGPDDLDDVAEAFHKVANRIEELR
jgi:dTDP-4-amino-4,6-dideoxygalactose transaminase